MHHMLVEYLWAKQNSAVLYHSLRSMMLAEDDDGWRAVHVPRTVLGPDRPSWLPQTDETASGRVRAVSDVSLGVTARAAKRKAQGDIESGGEAETVSRKEKKAKKEKKKKRHKEK